jgi:hypothetical protein
MPLPTASFGYQFGVGGLELGIRVNKVRDVSNKKALIVETAGTESSWQGASRILSRRIEMGGVIAENSQEAVQATWDEMVKYIGAGNVQKIYILGDRWVWGAIDGSVEREVKNYRRMEWSASFACGDPGVYENVLSVLNIGGVTTGNSNIIGSPTIVSIPGANPKWTTEFAGGGNTIQRPYLTFTIASIDSVGESFIRITNESTYLGGVTQTFDYYPTITGTYVAYFGENTTADATVNQDRLKRHRVWNSTLLGSANKYRQGEEISLWHTGNKVGLQMFGVTTTGNSTLQWHRRYDSV